MSSNDNNPTETLTAELTIWYKRRMLILFIMFAGFAAWFGYDWQVGYPKKAEIYKEYLSYKEKGEEGMREWAKIAAERKLGFENEKELAPFKADEGKIREQMYAMIVSATVALIVLANFLRFLGTKTVYGNGALILPGNKVVRVADITKVDTRKWMSKGLAYIWYADGDKDKKGVLDGMKYGGFKGEKPYLPDVMLEKIVNSFAGELIELQEEPKSEGETEGDSEVSKGDEANR